MHKKFRAKMKGKQAKWVATGNLQPAAAAAATAAWPEVAVGLLQMHKTYLIKTAKGAANFREAASLSAAAPLPPRSLPYCRSVVALMSCTRCTSKSKFFNRNQCQLQRQIARQVTIVRSLPCPSIQPSIHLPRCLSVTASLMGVASEACSEAQCMPDVCAQLLTPN